MLQGINVQKAFLSVADRPSRILQQQHVVGRDRAGDGWLCRSDDRVGRQQQIRSFEFGATGALEAVTKIVVDEGLEDAWRLLLEQHGVEVLVARSPSSAMNSSESGARLPAPHLAKASKKAGATKPTM